MLKKDSGNATMPNYYFMKRTVNGVFVDVEFDNLKDLDTFVEGMLNADYCKSDFIIVTVLEYNILADIAENEVTEPEGTTTPSGDGTTTP